MNLPKGGGMVKKEYNKKNKNKEYENIEIYHLWLGGCFGTGLM